MVAAFSPFKLSVKKDLDNLLFEAMLEKIKTVTKYVIKILHVPPQFIETPDRVVKVKGNSEASLSCRAFGFPPPTIVWSRGLVPLPQGRTTVKNGTLNISTFSPQDAGPYQSHQQAGSSVILAGNAFYQSRLHQFLTPAVGGHPQWVLCYRASAHGWRISTFHSRVKRWIHFHFQDLHFSLSNKEGVNPFKSMVTRTSHAIERTRSHGVTFCGGHDICINDNANSNTASYANFGNSYSAPSGVQDSSTILAGTKYFTPDEMEVFYLG
ncbi:hypothetical protein ACROYT_G030771 [Oculina patagonica]